ncbi:MAG: M28 family peptidase [Flavobacteriales bacterium]
MRKGKVFLFFQLICFSVFSQNINSARAVVDTLTSEYFAGRGAVDNGEKKAANFIANHFKKQGLKSVENSFFQEFNAPINTFPKALRVSFEGQEIIPGKDFIVDAASGGADGNFELYWQTNEHLLTKVELDKRVAEGFFTNKIVVLAIKNGGAENEVLQQLKENKIGAAGIVFIENELTQHLSPVAKNYPILHVRGGMLADFSKSIYIKIDQELISSYRSQNVIGYVEGTEFPDSFIVLSAHYDHLGKMGAQTYFPGANDNASGVALLLDLATHYSEKEPPVKSIIFIAFGAEESGLVGSKYFVNHPTIPLAQINFVFNMDLMGTGSEGGMIVNGRIYEEHFNKLIKINKEGKYLPSIKKRGKAANSDHYWFSENGVPSFFIYLMGGVSAYHDVDDISKTLPLTKYADSFRLIRDFVDEL